MELEDFGFNDIFEEHRQRQKLESFGIGRVISEHKERYTVLTLKGIYEAEITGNMRFTAVSREDFPAVGDWVALMLYEPDLAIIHSIYPRFSVIKRKAVGQFGEVQVIAANIDYAFLVQAVDRDFNINRLERYLTICNSARVKPIIVLSKTDLTDEHHLQEIIKNIENRIKDIPVIALSNETKTGISTLELLIEKGKTYCMLGSSGVGKSSLLNNLTGRNLMKTDSISQSTSKGRHVTSHRELTILDNGGILIDNPGMREVGIADESGGLEATFGQIGRLSAECKYQDCTHTSEPGCAVIEAVGNGAIGREYYENYLKMEKERQFYQSSLAERRKKDKEFGKMLKNYKKEFKTGK